MNTKLFFTSLFCTAAFIPLALSQQVITPAVKSVTTFAIITDSVTFAKAANEIRQYKSAIEREGLGTYVISKTWKQPGEIRNILRDLHTGPAKLEGAVLVGDIPVPMLRNAQHLTSVFKMDQRYNWQKSSVPSDRYYDDFHLSFTFLKQDSLQKNLFYYSLDASSPQKLDMDIYTGRIKPPAIPGKDKYELIRGYLRKAAEEKGRSNVLDQAMVSTSHSYNSESLNSWAGEQIALRQQFPRLFSTAGNIRFFNYRMNTFLKFNLLSELGRPDLDLAILHDHGDTDLQLINGYPDASNPQPSIENIKRYLRSKIQAAAGRKQDISKAKEGYVKWLDVPLSWMDDALLDSVVAADSVFNYNLDIHTADLVKSPPNARFVLLDACLNGAFHLDEYIAGYYAFGGGKNIVTVANSVGVLQDLWPDEMMGLLQYGLRAGNWLKKTATLETHLMGDPTFRFSVSSQKYNLNEALATRKTASYWKTMLSVADPDIQSLALSELAGLISEKEMSALLKNTYFSSPYETTRTEAIKLLHQYHNRDFLEVLKASVNDPYEFIRRRATYYIAEDGRDELVPALVHLAIADRHSERVYSRARASLPFMKAETVTAEAEKQLAASPWITGPGAVKADILASVRSGSSSVDTVRKILNSRDVPLKQRRFEVTRLRNYNYHILVPEVAAFVLNHNEDKQLRLAALEALSWFDQSHQRPAIEAMCSKILSDDSFSSEFKEEARRVRNIITVTPITN
ncbi:HEAT repeat domain-containing protein [Pararcticibacter amylolyticus]|uniref:HEAT repeat domain-containing protein n=1 Tax=Pararcticibacter amylolyticus TaxID=2173175 RepID=A0A2U2PJK7_9SPHI|nr:HEAT repeat domain-containing protein [Pararcticibacter amylolyticus]PWG81585.1 hypothetical protein DDR33_07070 [Pararcticibacter amylolyticus]